MYDDELKRVGRLIDKYCAKNIFENKNVYMFGVSDNTRQIVTMLRKHGIEPVAIIDNDTSKQYGYCARIKVLPIDGIENITGDDKFFIIYSAYWREMLGQFMSKGISENNILMLYKKRKNIVAHIAESYIGKVMYSHILKKYNTNTVFLCPYTGTGDIYLIGTFLNEYCEKNNIQNYAFVVITGACKKTASLCKIKNIHLLKKKIYSSYIIGAHMLWPEDVKIKILNDCWAQIHTNQIEWFRGYKNLEFTPLFKKYVFDLPDSSKPIHPHFNECMEEVDKIVVDNKIVKGKSVILSPYSNTLADLPDSIWVRIANELMKRGYYVYTNSCGESEPAIEGTGSIFFPLSVAPQLIEAAGYFIGVRSGFCDIISNAKAKKIILYDKANRFYMGSAFEYFNLKDMELCDDAIEIQYERNEDEIVAQILINI